MSVQALERLGYAAVALGGAGTLFQSSIYDVPGGHRAVIFDRFQGVKRDVVGEGTHFLVPWLQRAITCRLAHCENYRHAGRRCAHEAAKYLDHDRQ